MELFRQRGVMVSVCLPFLVVLVASGVVCGTVCPQGRQFLDRELQVCVDCSVCDGERGHVVLRPCEVHRDTICGPLSELTLDWRFLQGQQQQQQPPPPEARVRHAHHRYQQQQQQQQHATSKEKRVLWIFGNQPPTTIPEVQAEARIENTEHMLQDVTSTEMPFSNAETLIWDWQAVALTLSVFVCILFFLVIAFYSFHQARQWRRLKENFEADVEELSAQLRLMAAVNEKGELQDPCVESGNDPNYLKNRCNYLEHLLNVRKDTKLGSDAGNVYIEETNTKT